LDLCEMSFFYICLSFNLSSIWSPLIIFYFQMTYTHPSVRVVPKNGSNLAYLQ